MLREIGFGGVPMGDVFVERPVSGKPHTGKVLAAVQAHADDIPFFCAGTIAKLTNEGYTAYLIQTTNDEKCGPTPSIGETVLSNERDVDELTKVLGFSRVFNLGYRNHRMDGDAPVEIRARLIFLFRLLRVDTVFTFNPWGHGEENPDHWVTGAAVEAACWMAGMDKDFPEHLAAGIEPHGVREKYYWVAREGQQYNRVVDISSVVEKKIASISVNKSQGPGGSHGSRLKTRLASQNLRLPTLDGDDEAADRAYIRLFLLEPYAALGELYGLQYAEQFYYIGPRDEKSRMDEYIAKNAVPLKP
ncbi:MAG: PIG-L family deacetylase [Candidatus Bathyarchaeota archaeon]|nr:PIG-L family deacetylase [Candidatus Bathyarchaeota archaeon]